MKDMQIAADHWQDTTSCVPRDYRSKVSCAAGCCCCRAACSNTWCLQIKLMCSFMPASSKYKGTLEVPDPWFDDDAERRGFHRVSSAVWSELECLRVLHAHSLGVCRCWTCWRMRARGC